MHPHPYTAATNRGYYVFIHEDESPVEEKVQQQEASASTGGASSSSSYERGPGLEWDEEPTMAAETTNKNMASEDDSWSPLYKWYAQMLEQTAGLMDSNSTSIGAPRKVVNQVDVDRKTAAHHAAIQGHAGVLRLLLNTDCKIDSADASGFTPLHLAVQNGHSEAMRVLLDAGADPNRYTLNAECSKALHLAAAKGNVRNIDMLISAGSTTEARDNQGRTPLHVAVEERQTEAALRLAQIGCNVNVEDMNGLTPLCAAINHNSFELVSILLAAGARIPPHHYLLHQTVLFKQIEIVKLLIQYGSNVNLRNDDGDTPLLIAARLGHAETAKILLENGAAVDCQNSLTGSTALHEAVVCAENYSAFHDVFVRLREHRVNVNAICFSSGDTPLFRAILLGRDRIAKILIRNGADVNLCSLRHCVVDNLSLAMARKSMPVARLLVLAGASAPKEWGGHQPRPLSHLARLAIRRCIPSTRLVGSVEALPLPGPLKSFLMFERDEVDIE